MKFVRWSFQVASGFQRLWLWIHACYGLILSTRTLLVGRLFICWCACDPWELCKAAMLRMQTLVLRAGQIGMSILA